MLNSRNFLRPKQVRRLNKPIIGQLLPAIVTGLAIAGLAGSAGAQDTLSPSIIYDQNRSIKVAYTHMQQQARRFCKREASRIYGQGISLEARRFVKTCQGELMDKAVTKLQEPKLTAWHDVQTGRVTVLAQNNSTDG